MRKQINNLKVKVLWLVVWRVRIEVVCDSVDLWLNGRLVEAGELVVNQPIDDLRLANVAWPKDANPKFLYYFLFLLFYSTHFIYYLLFYF